MSNQMITHDLLVELSTEEQELLSGGRYGFYIVPLRRHRFYRPRFYRRLFF
ncbi:hypothetical protein HUN01_20915 [Nostoc edaphicum CCNP1411]|uniref:Uncharacterized protein n=1 Tax=Nostoc edaphicum CCNP1411 TaxID=1472755 RepID=A0A7D7LE69_9NOSO|nr:hypothetical protein [Nostoc edaphicum]QMS89928.1 hypothetical protein HUN01_20915 [Nostoc edaphicum CCNP1411]